MAVSFPGPIPVPPGQPMPQMPVQSNVYSDLGKALPAAGEEIIQADERWKKLEEMIERRKLAIETQRALEDYRTRDMEFKKQQELEDQRQFGIQEKRMDSRNADLKEQAAAEQKFKQDQQDKINNANAAYYKFKAENKRVPNDDETRAIAYENGIGEDWIDYARRKPASQNYFMREGKKKEDAGNLLPYLNDQLTSLVKDFSVKAGLPFSKTRILLNPRTNRSHVFKDIPAESEKRTRLAKLREKINAKHEEIAKARVTAGLPYDGDSYDKDDAYQKALDRNAELKEIKRRKAEMLQKANTNPDPAGLMNP